MRYCARRQLFSPRRMVGFIEAHRKEYGVEPICRELPIAPSTYFEHRARARDPERPSEREKRDVRLCREIQRVWETQDKREPKLPFFKFAFHDYGIPVIPPRGYAIDHEEVARRAAEEAALAKAEQ